MPSSLIANLNSDYIEALGDLLSRRLPEPILVYVESYEDISFWNGILENYESPKIKFDIQLPSHDSLTKGKHEVLQRFKNNVGPYLILCLDSDYDYLLQDKTEQSRLINQNKFIFQTYAYSIENLRCFSPSLRHVSIQASHKTHDKIDFEELLKRYSTITYPLFVWSVFLETIGDKTTMDMTTFCSHIRVQETIKIEEDKGENYFQAVSHRVITQVNYLETTFPQYLEDVENLKTELKNLDVNPENTYLFIQGHAVEDNFVLMFMNPLHLSLKKEYENSIRTLAKNSNEIAQEINHYNNKISEPKEVLKTNTEYKSCFLYQKIKTDLDQFIQTIDI
jgi:prefoldin subunit 5